MAHGQEQGRAEETDVWITPPRTWAVGVPAVANPLRYSFDCPACVWPETDPPHRHRNEDCEKAAST
ncbi:hypothetical protein [Streptomyces sp. NPDC059893]|uniref:hypothetical protein n=1 Tax=Streptomyces sp. NPDC059893 TaxID=3346990 RepID=UPI0036694AEA